MPAAAATMERACAVVCLCLAIQSAVKLAYARERVRTCFQGGCMLHASKPAGPAAPEHCSRPGCVPFGSIMRHAHSCRPWTAMQAHLNKAVSFRPLQEMVCLASIALYSTALYALTLALHARGVLATTSGPAAAELFIPSRFALHLATAPAPWLLMFQFQHVGVAHTRRVTALNALAVACGAVASAPALPAATRAAAAAPLLALVPFLSVELWCAAHSTYCAAVHAVWTLAQLQLQITRGSGTFARMPWRQTRVAHMQRRPRCCTA
jgi:hypothetical protein